MDYNKMNHKLLAAFRHGDLGALERLIENNEGLIRSLVKKYGCAYEYRVYDHEDLEQAAKTGMLKAASDYDASVDCSFSTYAYNRMRFEILNELNPSHGDYRKQPVQVSLDEMFDADSSSERSARIPDLSIDVERAVIHMQTRHALRDVLNDMAEGDRQFVYERYGLYGYKAHTTEELARKYKTSGKAIRAADEVLLKKIADRIA